MRNKKPMLVIIALLLLTLVGCSNLKEKEQSNNQDDNQLSENVILTETGEMIVKEVIPESEQEPERVLPTTTPIKVTPEVQPEKGEGASAIKPLVELIMPEQEKVVTEVEQIEPITSELQLVFLGDSIFDNNRDGTGIPYLTAQKCDAGLYNLAIGGTSATVEWEEQVTYESWTSRSLCGVVNAMMRVIPTDIFAGTSVKEILDNPNADFSKTDYFIVEYGLNDYFRAVPLSIDGTTYDIRCYAGALRYAVSNLTDIAPDATIILCAPNYSQFFTSDGFMIGDGNSVNTGYGTLFDYKGTCNYVANERQALFFNAYQDLGIDGYTAEQYLEDGVHLTEEGRELYADALSKMILSHEETKNN